MAQFTGLGTVLGSPVLPPFPPSAMGPSGPGSSLCPHSQPACQVPWEQQKGGNNFALCHPWVGAGPHRPLCVLCAGEGGEAWHDGQPLSEGEAEEGRNPHRGRILVEGLRARQGTVRDPGVQGLLWEGRKGGEYGRREEGKIGEEEANLRNVIAH